MSEIIHRELFDENDKVVGYEYGGRLVRCKDCKHSSYEPCEGYDNVYVCNRTPFARMEGGRLPNFYCGYGERREE